MTPPAAPTRRITRGGGHSYKLDGEDVRGVTTILGDGLPKPALIGWAANATAGYAVDHWAELDAMSVSERLDKLKRGRYEASKAAGERGTEVHRYAHELALGIEVAVPEELLPHVDHYLRWAEEWAVEEVLVEAVILNRRWHYMGTLDLVALIAGERWLIDYKTGGGVYPEVALQLAGYANAEHYLGPDGLELEFPRVDRAGVLWVRADGFDFYEVPRALELETFRTFLYAAEVAKFTRAPREDFIGPPLRRPELEVAR